MDRSGQVVCDGGGGAEGIVYGGGGAMGMMTMMASCTPATLKNLAMSRLAQMMIDSALPLPLRKYAPLLNPSNTPDPKVDPDCQCSKWHEGSQAMETESPGGEFDVRGDSIVDVILAEDGGRREHLLADKELLLSRLSALVAWCRSEVWVGGCDSRLVCGVRWKCSEMLRRTTSYRRYPLFLLTLELLFCTEAGHNPMLMKWVLIPECVIYNKFLSHLQPFGIMRLYTSFLNFDCPSVITTICRESPALKFVHLRIIFAVGQVLRELGKCVPRLETLVILVKEYEVYDSMSSTANIVILAGENFAGDLFFGFFDGMSKKEVEAKVQSGQVKDVRLSFPRLKYVDVGSHRDVREFLHYLLHLYPDLRSISCDGEGWRLSKYSLSFPTVTPSTLGSGPEALQACKTLSNIQDMSFSSFCLASQLPSIMEKYRSLRHISLHLLKGPWKINTTCQMARDLLAATKCRCFTICVDVYMSSEDLVSLYYPALKTIGSNLTILQFHLTNEVTSRAVRQLINMCGALQELSIVSSCERCEVAEDDEGEEHVPLNNLLMLRCLGISSQYNVTSSLFKLTSELLTASPNLTTLELEFGGGKFTKWLLHTASRRQFSQLKRLRLSLVYRGPSMEDVKELGKVDVERIFEPVIAGAPELLQLLVGGGCKCLFQALQERYGGTQLDITVRDQPCVAFRTLASRCY